MPLHYRLEDLPERFRLQAERALAPRIRANQSDTSPKTRKTDADPNGSGSQPKRPLPKPIQKTPKLEERDYAPSSVSRPPLRDFHGDPNKTEKSYNAEVLAGNGRYEAVTLRLPGGNYTPDWMTIDDGVVTFHEVKGSYRFGSESRAILAFREAAALFPFWRFVWAQRQKNGKWSVKHVLNTSEG